MLTNTDPVDDEICDEIEALLHTVQEYCKEQLTGVPVDVSNPIVDSSCTRCSMRCRGCMSLFRPSRPVRQTTPIPKAAGTPSMEGIIWPLEDSFL